MGSASIYITSFGSSACQLGTVFPALGPKVVWQLLWTLLGDEVKRLKVEDAGLFFCSPLLANSFPLNLAYKFCWLAGVVMPLEFIFSLKRSEEVKWEGPETGLTCGNCLLFRI